MLKKVVLLVGTLILFSGLASGNEEFELGEILIKGLKNVYYYSIDEISSKDITKKNARTVEQALEFIPGVRISVGNKNEPDIRIRGMGQDRVLTLLDGIPISSPVYGYIDMSQFSTENIAKIEIIKGTSSVLYGANGFSGVINIITKKPAPASLFQWSLGVLDNARSYDLNFGLNFDKIYLWFTGSYLYSPGFLLSSFYQPAGNEDGGLRSNSDYRKRSVSARVGLKELERHDICLSAFYINNEKGIPPSDTGTLKYYNCARFPFWQYWSVSLADEYRMNERAILKSRVYYNKSDNIYATYKDTIAFSVIKETSTYDDYTAGGNIQFFLEISGWNYLRTNASIKVDSHNEKDTASAPWESYIIHTYSLGAENEISISEKLKLLAGLSWDIFLQKYAYTGRMNPDVYTLNPLVAATYTFNENNSVFANVSRKTLFPTLHQLYSNRSGNPDLKEQTNIKSEIGIRGKFFNLLSTEVIFFYNDVTNLIQRASKNDPYINCAHVVYQGIEMNLRSMIGKFLNMKVGYTYLNSRDEMPQLLKRTSNILPYTPEHKIDAELNFIFGFGLSGVIYGTYSSLSYYYDKQTLKTLDGFTVWNLSVEQKLFWNLTANLTVTNIFDLNYQEEYGYPQPGREIWLGIRKNM